VDLLWFFKEKMHFQEIKIRFALLNTPATPDPPRPDPLRPAPCGLRVAETPVAAARDPVRGSCGSARCGPACGRGRVGPATADPSGRAAAAPACDLRCTGQ
jgi:hypothetical protein